MKISVSALVIFAVISMACNNNTAANSITTDDHSYKAEVVGWTVTIPDGWEIMGKKAVDTIGEVGRKTISDKLNVSVDSSDQTDLLNIQKDSLYRNVFLSNVSPANQHIIDEPEKFFQYMYRMYKVTNRERTAEYEEGKEQIDGLLFYTFTMRAHSASRPGVVIRQKQYSRLINKQIFQMTLQSDNDKDAEALDKMVSSSTFSIRD